MKTRLALNDSGEGYWHIQHALSSAQAMVRGTRLCILYSEICQLILDTNYQMPVVKAGILCYYFDVYLGEFIVATLDKKRR